MSSIRFYCKDCGKSIRVLTPAGCRCGSMNIRKQVGTDKEWLDWFYKNYKDIKKWSKICSKS